MKTRLHLSLNRILLGVFMVLHFHVYAQKENVENFMSFFKPIKTTTVISSSNLDLKEFKKIPTNIKLKYIFQGDSSKMYYESFGYDMDADTLIHFGNKEYSMRALYSIILDENIYVVIYSMVSDKLDEYFLSVFNKRGKILDSLQMGNYNTWDVEPDYYKISVITQNKIVVFDFINNQDYIDRSNKGLDISNIAICNITITTYTIRETGKIDQEKTEHLNSSKFASDFIEMSKNFTDEVSIRTAILEHSPR